MGSFRVRFKNMNQIKSRIRNMKKNIPAIAETIIDNNFIQATNYAQENAPWTDRTGDARRSIDYSNESDADMLRFVLFIGVYYGIFLEVSNGGKYRILQPTMTVFEQRIKKDLEKVGGLL